MAETKTQKTTYHHGDLRDVLIDAARAELEETGLEAFSLRKVARRAGVSHAAPAHHFGDAAGLLTALATLGFREFLAAMVQRGAAAERDAEAQLIAAGLGYLDFAIGNNALFRLIHASARPSHTDPDLLEAARASFQHLVDLVASGTDRPCDDAQTYLDAVTIWSNVHGLADLYINGRLQRFHELSGDALEAGFKSVLRAALPGDLKA